jgi:hypothetical protein
MSIACSHDAAFAVGRWAGQFGGLTVALDERTLAFGCIPNRVEFGGYDCADNPFAGCDVLSANTASIKR